MPNTVFASIDVGSNELAMKIFEISKKNEIKELEYIRHTTELGAQTYTKGNPDHDMIEELCTVLTHFTWKLKEYQIADFTVCATSAIREAKNQILILDQIKQRTGLKVKVLSNSEQRFLCYKALASKEEMFHKIIEKGTAIIDASAGSVQITQYHQGMLVNTQNLRLGSLRIREILSSMEHQTLQYNHLIEDYIYNDLATYRHLFIKEHKIKRIVAFGDQLRDLIRLSKKIDFGKLISKEVFQSFYQSINKKTLEQLSRELSISKDHASLLLPTAMIYEKFLEITGAEELYFSDIILCDGLVADYVSKKNKSISSHSFEQDIISASRNIAKRYECVSEHSTLVEYVSLRLFDSMKKYHGLGKRERLLLQLAVILLNCGEYINMNEVPLNSYRIVMSTEIIGISHLERELVANLVRHKTSDFPKYSRMLDGMDKDTYLTLSKLTAILRLANAMAKSHLKKFEDNTISIKENHVLITADTLNDISLEQVRFKGEADFFEEVYGIRPVLKQKRSN